MRKKLFTLFVVACLCAVIYPQFGMFATVRAAPTNFSVDVLLDYGNGTRIWFTCVLSTLGNDTVYNATQAAAATLNVTWYGDDVFVDAINGVWNNFTTNYYWLYWYWNFTSESWNYGPVACNKYLLNNGDVIAWYYETAPWGPPATAPSEILADVNDDGIVDIHDIVIAALAFGSYSGHPRWNPIVDLNRDGLIDIFDLVKIAINFGKTPQ